MHEYIRINDKQNRYYSLSDPLYIPYRRRNIHFNVLTNFVLLNIFIKLYILTCCVVCLTKAHHTVIPFVMASPLFLNNDLTRLTLCRVSSGMGRK